jgi:hypothetical protein
MVDEDLQLLIPGTDGTHCSNYIVNIEFKLTGKAYRSCMLSHRAMPSPTTNYLARWGKKKSARHIE